MSNNKNIRSKFESEEYLKNFIPNDEDKNRFFEFYEEQEIKKSLKEKFFSEQYIQSFKVSKKEWQLFEKTYLPSYWNYNRIALYVFFVLSILGGLIGYYYFHKLHDTPQSHLINASSIEKDKLNTEQKDNINENTHSSNQIVSSKFKSFDTTNNRLSNQNNNQFKQINIENNVKISASNTSKSHSKKLTSTSPNNIPKNKVTNVFNKHTENNSINNNTSAITTNTLNTQNEDDFNKNHLANNTTNTNIVSSQSYTYNNDDMLSSLSPYFLIPNNADDDITILSTPTYSYLPIKKHYHHIDAIIGGVWNIRYNNNTHNVSPYAGFNYIYTFNKHIGFNIGVAYFNIQNIKTQFLVRIKSEYDFGLQKDSSIMRYTRLDIIRVPFNFVWMNKYGSIKFGIALDYILSTQSKLYQYQIKNSSIISQNTSTTYNYANGLNLLNQSIIVGYSYPFTNKLSANIEVYSNLKTFGKNESYIINSLQKGSGIIIGISYNLIRY